MKESNKDDLPGDRWMPRMAHHLREFWARQGRIVSGQMLRGASYGLGSGAVSLLVVWFEARH